MGGKIQAWFVCVKCGHKVRKMEGKFYPAKCSKCGGKLVEKVVVLK